MQAEHTDAEADIRTGVTESTQHQMCVQFDRQLRHVSVTTKGLTRYAIGQCQSPAPGNRLRHTQADGTTTDFVGAGEPAIQVQQIHVLA